jgi:hypothetical protein
MAGLMVQTLLELAPLQWAIAHTTADYYANHSPRKAVNLESRANECRSLKKFYIVCSNYRNMSKGRTT